MKALLLLVLAGLAMSFPVSAFAQEQKAVDPELRRQIETVLMNFDQAYNKYDAVAIGALYTQDGGELWAWWPSVVAFASGRPAIEKRFAALFAQRPVEVSDKLVGLYAIGNDICAIVDVAGPWKGNSVTIYVRDADTWKTRMAYVNNTAQDKKPIDSQVRQQIQAVHKEFYEANNKRNAPAMAALYTQDAVQTLMGVMGTGTNSGQQAIEKSYEAEFASSPPECIGEFACIWAIGNDMATISKWNCGMYKGYSVKVYVRDSETWKIRMEYVTR